MICNVACLKTRGMAAEQQFGGPFFFLSVCHASSLKVGVLVRACACVACVRACACVCVHSCSRPCVLAQVQLSAFSWRRSDLWNPTVLIMVYVWETSNLPPLPLPHPLGYTHTELTQTRKTHKSLKGTFTIAPSFTRLTMGDQLSTAVSFYWKDESLFSHRHFYRSRQYVCTTTRLQLYILLLTGPLQI